MSDSKTFQDEMKLMGAKPGFYVATVPGGSMGQPKMQRVLDHSAALFSQGYRWTGPESCQVWVGGAIRTYRWHSDDGEGLRAFKGTIKRGREMHEIDGYAPDLDRADAIMQDALKNELRGHNVKYYGVQWA